MKRKLPRLAILAETALNKAVAKIIEEHRRTGDPIAIWQDGKVRLVHPDQLPEQEDKERKTPSGKKAKK